MMNISELFDFIKHHSLYCLSPLRIYVYLNIFNHCILQYIIYIYIYPRWLGMLIDKGDKEKWLPLQLLTETQEKNRRRHTTAMCKNTSSKPGTSSKQNHSNKMQVQRVQENTTATQKYSIDYKCFAISPFFGTLWVT